MCRSTNVGLAAVFAVFLIAGGCGTSAFVASPDEQVSEGGCSSVNTLPPIVLNAEQEDLLRTADSDSPPRTAFDYYLRLNPTHFSIMPHDAKHRVWYVDMRTLSDDYLHARYWFDCDNGGFELTLRIFRNHDADLIALASSVDKAVVLMEAAENRPGRLTSVAVWRPAFWHFVKGEWRRENDTILPMIPLERVLDLRVSKWKAHLDYPEQTKFICLEYELPAIGDVIAVTGRENFMDPGKRYEWAHYRFGKREFTQVD